MRNAMAVPRAPACLMIAALLASNHVQAQPGAVRSLLEIRQHNVVIQQWDMSCGAAALATILTYQLGDPVPEKRVAQGMLRRTDPLRVKHRGGFSLLDMKRYAEGRGYRAEGYSQLTLENLRKLAPAIVPVRLEGYDHFVIFRGVAAGAAVLADPAFGNRKLPVAEFQKTWNGNIGFVVTHKNPAGSGNRIAPRNADFIAVRAESIRAVMATDMPSPLADWQLANLSWSSNRNTATNARTPTNRSDRMPLNAPATIPGPGAQPSNAAPAPVLAVSPPVAAAGTPTAVRPPTPSSTPVSASGGAPVVSISPSGVELPAIAPPASSNPAAPALSAIDSALTRAAPTTSVTGLVSNPATLSRVPLLPALLGR